MRDISGSVAKLAVSLHTITEKNEASQRSETVEPSELNPTDQVEVETLEKQETLNENSEPLKLPRPPSIPNNVGSNASLSRRTSMFKSPSRKSLGSASKITISPSKTVLREVSTPPNSGSKPSSRGSSAGKRSETQLTSLNNNSTAKLTRRSSTATLQSISGDLENLGPVQSDDFGRVKVYVRVRPMNQDEVNNNERNALSLEEDSKQVTVSESGKKEQAFAFDHVFPSTANNKDIFTTVAKPIVTAAMQGFNGTLMSYGQTSSGKTYTLMSPDGVMARTVHYLFKQAHKDIHHDYKVKCSYIQVYQERIYDLLGDIRPGSLSPTKLNQDDVAQYELNLRESPEKGVWVEGLSEFVAERPRDIFELLQAGRARLVFGETKMNRASSRSHAIFFLTVERSSKKPEDVKILSEIGKSKMVNDTQESDDEDNFEFQEDGETNILGNQQEQQDNTLNVETGRDIMLRGRIAICDLAGSERIKKTLASGDRLSEAQHINLSLLELGNVIHALTDPKRSHIPFRNAVLTRLLQESLGGNCRTSLIVCVSPSQRDAQETRGTLAFGYRAMRIKNCARVNVEVDYKALADALAAQIGDKEKEWCDREAKIKADLDELQERFQLVNNECEFLKARINQLEEELQQKKTNDAQENKEEIEKLKCELQRVQELDAWRAREKQDEKMKYLSELIRWETACQDLKKAVHDDIDMSETDLLESLKALNETLMSTTDLQKWFNTWQREFNTALTHSISQNEGFLRERNSFIGELIEKLNLAVDDTDANAIEEMPVLQLFNKAYQTVTLHQALLFIEISKNMQQPPPLPPKEKEEEEEGPIENEKQDDVANVAASSNSVQMQQAKTESVSKPITEAIPGAIVENEELKQNCTTSVSKLQTRPPTVVGDVDDHIEREAARRAQTCRVGRLACTFM